MSKYRCTCSSFALQYEGCCSCGYEADRKIAKRHYYESLSDEELVDDTLSPEAITEQARRYRVAVASGYRTR